MTASTTEPGAAAHREVELQKLDDVVIRFAGDSGDGMQLTGTQFTNPGTLPREYFSIFRCRGAATWRRCGCSSPFSG